MLYLHTVIGVKASEPSSSNITITAEARDEAIEAEVRELITEGKFLAAITHIRIEQQVPLFEVRLSSRASSTRLLRGLARSICSTSKDRNN